MTDGTRRPPTFADACEAVLADPAASHSEDTTLAPVRVRSIPEGWAERRARLVVSRLPADVDGILELGSGVGALLRRLSGQYEAVGVDERRAHLRFSQARGTDSVQGAPTRPPVRSVFDAAVAVEDAVGRASAVDLCVSAFRSLRPGGIAVVAAPTDPAAVAEPGVATYSGSRYRLERAVDIVAERRSEAARRQSGDTGHELVVDYRVTDRQTGDSAVVTDRRPVQTTTADGLTGALRTAGFESVLVSGESDLAGLVVGRGVRPVETGVPTAELDG
ncbi:SAM-dependent methyltransferase [Halobellus rarus]|uniref:SAM-dependent methyltransferase n=1 Tax=Halobellus rarus TaxID=1126237 RepID=A0ABD6CNQ3_9EURY|nr:class I SAM-dependent methyltransferase [Halobellus rarus]